jgi:predicted Rossmann fold flavoprotein
MKSTAASCSAMVRPSRSWRCCWPNARPARCNIGSPVPCTACGTARAASKSIAIAAASARRSWCDFGYRLAQQFGHGLVEPRPGLVPLVFDAATWAPFAALAGLSLEVGIAAGAGKTHPRFVEDLLFTHRGLSGPAVLQASSFWRAGEALHIDLAPGRDLSLQLRQDKLGSRRQLGNQLALYLPQRLADTWLATHRLDAQASLPQHRDRDLAALGDSLRQWQIVPTGSEGWRKAEVTVGGVDTKQLDSRNLQSLRIPGLHFIGEVVDVTGWLGGYNFQWAWASAAACARSLTSPAQGRNPR